MFLLALQALLLAPLLRFLPVQAATTLEHAQVSVLRSDSVIPGPVEDVALPYHWDRLQGAVDGAASFSMNFHVDDPAAPQAITIARVGNTFEIRLNGTVISAMGTPGDPYKDYAKQARLFQLPKELLRNTNRLEVTVHVMRGRNGGLSQITVGSLDEIRALYLPTHRLQILGSLVVIVVSLVLGSLSFLVWLRQRDRLYLFYGAGEYLWAVGMSDGVLDTVPLPWPWWGLIYFSATVFSAVLIFKFALIVAGRHQGILKRLTNWHMAICIPVVLVGLLGGFPWMEQAWKTLTDLLLISIIIDIVRHCLFSKDLEKRGLAWIMTLLGLVGMRDEIVLILMPYVFHPDRQNDPFADFTWSRYAWVLFGISLVWIIAERMRKSSQEIAGMNQTLAARLAQREAELGRMFANQTDAARNHAAMEERQRLMRDMHDGLGSQLVAALQLSHDPEVSREALSEQLRDTLDQLKLTVDAMQDTEGDIAALLGALRYRIAPRLDAAGIELTWAVELLPAIEGWSLPQSRDLQMILYEAFSNLIVHSQASRASLSAWHEPGGIIHIVLRDNGRGFDAGVLAGHGGHGMRNMRSRALRMGADLLIDGSADGAEVRLCITRQS